MRNVRFVTIKTKICRVINNSYLSLSLNDIYTVWNTEIYCRVNDIYTYYSFFNKLVNEYDYNAKDLWLYLDRIKTFLVMYECMMKAYKVTIPANAFPYHMNENGDFEICIPSEENK